MNEQLIEKRNELQKEYNKLLLQLGNIQNAMLQEVAKKEQEIKNQSLWKKIFSRNERLKKLNELKRDSQQIKDYFYTDDEVAKIQKRIREVSNLISEIDQTLYQVSEQQHRVHK
jgi:hypothetical protein